jgi:hypothetical protein
MAELFETLTPSMSSAYEISKGLHRYVQKIDTFLKNDLFIDLHGSMTSMEGTIPLDVLQPGPWSDDWVNWDFLQHTA